MSYSFFCHVFLKKVLAHEPECLTDSVNEGGYSNHPPSGHDVVSALQAFFFFFFSCELGVDLPLWTWQQQQQQQQNIIPPGREFRFTLSWRWPWYLLTFSSPAIVHDAASQMDSWILDRGQIFTVWWVMKLYLWNWLMLPLLMLCSDRFDLKKPMYWSLCAEMRNDDIQNFAFFRMQWNKMGLLNVDASWEMDGCRVFCWQYLRKWVETSAWLWNSGLEQTRCSADGWGRGCLFLVWHHTLFIFQCGKSINIDNNQTLKLCKNLNHLNWSEKADDLMEAMEALVGHTLRFESHFSVGGDDACQSLLMLDPPEVVGELGEDILVNCTTSEESPDAVFWTYDGTESELEEEKNFLQWPLHLSKWNTTAKCTVKLNETFECSKDLQITVYSKCTSKSIHHQ